jgi:organic hydroperoxide reductase OsmC/OhrA
MSTFLSFGGRKGIPLKSYKSTAEGVLENLDGKYRFSKIIIKPEVVVGAEWTREHVEEVFHQAHEHCLVANSMTTLVFIEPTIIIE